MTRTLAGKTVFVSGGSRGIGKAIALRCAKDGANVVIAGKSHVQPPRLPGTIHSAAAECEAIGGKALAVRCDIREEAEIEAAVAAAVERFGGIDVLVNNASAIWLKGLLDTPSKRFDLMNEVNVRGTFLVTQACMPHLLRAANPHVLMLSPPLALDPKWFAGHTAYTMSKYGMSMCALGLAAEFRDRGVAVNALWPKTVIQTAALQMLPGIDVTRCRLPEIVADAAHAIVTTDSKARTGAFLVDEDVLRENGVRDFARYAVDPSKELLPDFFLD